MALRSASATGTSYSWRALPLRPRCEHQRLLDRVGRFQRTQSGTRTSSVLIYTGSPSRESSTRRSPRREHQVWTCGSFMERYDEVANARYAPHLSGMRVKLWHGHRGQEHPHRERLVGEGQPSRSSSSQPSSRGRAVPLRQTTRQRTSSCVGGGRDQNAMAACSCVPRWVPHNTMLDWSAV